MSKPRTYKDLRLELRNYNPADETYEAALLPDSTWQNLLGDVKPEKLVFNKTDISGLLTGLEYEKLEINDQVKLGKALADRLLPQGSIRAAFVKAVEAQGIDQGVRLRLTIHQPALMQIPWEYTYLKIGGGWEESEEDQNRTHFLVLNPRISLVRHPPQNGPWASLVLPDSTQLRMLAVMANPEHAQFSRLDLDTERRVLEEALNKIKVERVQIAWKPFRDDITEAELDDALKEKPQIFHFSGHGKFGLEDEQAMLFLVGDKDKNTPEPLEAGALADKLAAHSVRLAYLTACETSRIDGVSGWTGIAPKLIAAGVPAVVAMQYKLDDQMASHFSQGFYSALVNGLSIDEAILLGRQAMLHKSTERDLDWGVPTLYLRATDGVLFREITKKMISPVDASAVLFDEGHGQERWYAPRPVISDGFRKIADIAKEQADVSSLLSINDEALETCKVFVLTMAPEGRTFLTDDEIKAIKNFVHRGGGLLVLGAYTGDLHHEANLNRILDMHGMFFNGNVVMQPRAREVDGRNQWVERKPDSRFAVDASPGPGTPGAGEQDVLKALLAGVSSVRTLSACSLYVHDNLAAAVLESPRLSVILKPEPHDPPSIIRRYMKDGHGPATLLAASTTSKVVAAGCWTMFLNDFIDYEGFDNRQLFRNILNWLTS